TWSHRRAYPEARHCPAPTDRQFRLIAAACGRYVRDEFGDDLPLELLDAVERFSEDGKGAGAVLSLVGKWSAYTRAVVRTPPRIAAVTALRLTLQRSREARPNQLRATRKDRLMPALRQAGLGTCSADTADAKRTFHAISRSHGERDRAEAARLVACDQERLCQ